MSTVSARPDNLAAYRSKLEGVDRDLRSTAGNLLQSLQTYRTRSPQYGADHTELAYSLGEHATAMEDLDSWVGRVGDAFRQADRAPGPVPVGVVLTTEESVKVAEPEFEELEPEGGMDAKAIAGLIADIAGIFDPTPISDGVSAGISLSDGDWAGAGLSVASMFPYVGDAVAKPVKFVRKILDKFPALKRLAESGALLDLLKHIDWKNPARLNRALGTLAGLQRKAELAYKNTDWRKKAKRLRLPTEGGVPFVPPKNWDVNFPKRESVGGRDGYVDAFGNIWVRNGDGWFIQPRKGFESLTKDGSSKLTITRDGKLQDAQILWKVPDGVTAKFPESWGRGLENSTGTGRRWFDPANESGIGVRIDKGDPNSGNPSQRQDHVVVRRDGKVIGRDGKPIKGSIEDNGENAHIPLSEYRNWTRWDSP